MVHCTLSGQRPSSLKPLSVCSWQRFTQCSRFHQNSRVTQQMVISLWNSFCHLELHSQQAQQLGWLPCQYQPSRNSQHLQGSHQVCCACWLRQKKLSESWNPKGFQRLINTTIKDDSGGRRNNTFIITFKTPAVPKYLNIGYIRVPVSVYIPNPLRCFNCQKFGHTKNACKVNDCATCGQIGHNNSKCTKWGEVPKVCWQSLCLQQKLP